MAGNGLNTKPSPVAKGLNGEKDVRTIVEGPHLHNVSTGSSRSVDGGGVKDEKEMIPPPMLESVARRQSPSLPSVSSSNSNSSTNNRIRNRNRNGNDTIQPQHRNMISSFDNPISASDANGTQKKKIDCQAAFRSQLGERNPPNGMRKPSALTSPAVDHYGAGGIHDESITKTTTNFSRSMTPVAEKSNKRSLWWCNLSSPSCSESSSVTSSRAARKSQSDLVHHHENNENAPKTKVRWDNDLISSASDNDSTASGIRSRCSAVLTTTTRNDTSRLIGKEILTRNIHDPGLQNRATNTTANNRNVLAHAPKRIPSQTVPLGIRESALQRKAPPNSTTVEESKNTILTIHEQIEEEKEKMRQSVFEAEYSRAFTQKSSSPKTSHSRCTPIAKTVQLQYKKRKRSLGRRYHTVIVKSSLTVLPTSDDTKLKDDAEQIDIQTKACNLSLMPHEYKSLQEDFASILDKLPPHHQYNPDTHDFVSQLLDTPPDDICEKLEAPPRFKAAPSFALSEQKAGTNTNGPDENDTDYLSIMNGFRDFCPQCKNFDCHFHITTYPDAATQASVAIQYDKRAILQRSRRIRQTETQNNYTDQDLDNSDFLVETQTPSHNSLTVEASKPFRAQVGDTSIVNLGGESMECPFCKFSCNHSEKLSKHMKRYHTDTFYFKESNNKIEATMRTDETATLIPAREYFHANSFIPIQRGHFDRESDDESLYSWYHDYREDLLQDYSDLSEKEKRIQCLWNRFQGCSPIVIPDKAIPKRCLGFVQKHFVDLWEMEWEFYQLLITFWERHVLSVIDVENVMLSYHRERELKLGKQNMVPLSPRKLVICSRLYLMFQSFHEGMPRLLKAIRRRDLRSQDIVTTPLLNAIVKWPKLSRKRKIGDVIRMRAKDISRPFFFPCFHAGSCTKANKCSCIENNRLCTKHCVWGEYGVNFFQGCFCTGDCSTAKQCTCRDMNRECDPDVCTCCASKRGSKRKCSNMDVSLAKRVPLLIGVSSVDGAGLGLFTKNGLKKGDYIDEYIGEFIKREHEVNRTQEYYFDHSDDYVIDATYQGNKTRFLNHSQTPNIEAKHRFVNGEKRVAFYAKQDIPPQTELFYSYGKSYNKIWRSKGLSKLCVDSDDDGYEERSD